MPGNAPLTDPPDADWDTDDAPGESAGLEADEQAPEAAAGDVDGDAVADRVRRRSESIAHREVERALRMLEARGDLTDAQRCVVRDLADGIVESLVASPARTVEAADAADDEILRTVVELFDPGQ